MQDWKACADAIRTAAQAGRQWIGAVPQADGDKLRYTPWMPFQLFTFTAMLAEALPEADGPRFLEIGAGPGSCMLIAREVFGLDVHGIERTDEYAAAARALGLDVPTHDALSWPHYGNYDIIWFNRVFRDPAPETELESLVWRTADPGTVILCANLEGRPPGSWFPVLDSWDSDRRGIWQKPAVPAGS